MSGIQQAGALPPSSRPEPTSAARMGHYAMVAGMVVDAERALDLLRSLEEIPLPLLARLARALNLAERDAMRRVQTMEEETS